MIINVNGKTYNSVKEYADAEKNNPNSTTIVWDYQEYDNCVFVNGRMIHPDGSYGTGKCHYKGKTYEGKIEYKDNKLYVGGEFVKDMSELGNETYTGNSTYIKHINKLIR